MQYKEDQLAADRMYLTFSQLRYQYQHCSSSSEMGVIQFAKRQFDFLQLH
jgi:hypothetical protein